MSEPHDERPTPGPGQDHARQEPTSTASGDGSGDFGARLNHDTPEPAAPDDALRAAVEQVLAALPGRFEVKVERAEAYLYGEVDDPDVRRRAVEAALAVPGVRDVYDSVRLRGEGGEGEDA